MTEALWDGRISPQSYAVQRISRAGHKRADQPRRLQLRCRRIDDAWIDRTLISCRASRAKRRNSVGLASAICDIQQRRLGWIETRRIKVRTLTVKLEKRRVPTPAHAIIQGELSRDFPFILGIPLQQTDFAVREIAMLRFGISVEVAEERIRVRESCIAGSRRKTVSGAGAEIQTAGPLATARRLTIEQPLRVDAELEVVR